MRKRGTLPKPRSAAPSTPSLAGFHSMLTCEAIAVEPARDWSAPLNEKRSSDAKELQSQFIASLGYQSLTMAHAQTASAGQQREITIFDAIRQAAQLSLDCGCIFRVPPMTPPRRRA